MNQTFKSPLVTNMSDDVNVIVQDNITRQKTGVTAYALANIFKGIPLNSNTDLDTITQACLRRVDNTAKNGPPIADITGYLHVISHYHAVNAEATAEVRIRQIIYPDNVNDPTPYTRVGYAATPGGTITWSMWNTLGGNMIRKILTKSITTANANASEKYALPNTMYESFGNWTLQLPNPNNYGLGTRIGLEQYAGNGKVTFVSGSDTFDQNTAPDIDIDNNYIGAIIYLFEVVDAAGSTLANPVYEWKMDTLQNYDGVIAGLQGQISEHRLPDQDNLYGYLIALGNTSYIVPQDGFVLYEYVKNDASSFNTAVLKRNGLVIVSHAKDPSAATGGTRTTDHMYSFEASSTTIKAVCIVRAGDVITYQLGAVATTYNVKIIFSPDEHVMYLREDELNSSWHDDSSLATKYADGYFTKSLHLYTSDKTPASVKAVLGLWSYVDERDTYILNQLKTHTDKTGINADDCHSQYLLKRSLNHTYHTATAGTDANKLIAPSMDAINALSTQIQSKGLLYGPIAKSSVSLDSILNSGMYEVTSCSGGPVEFTSSSATGTLVVINKSTATAATMTQPTEDTSNLLQIFVSRNASTNNIWYRQRIGSTTFTQWTRFAKSKLVIPVTGSLTAANIITYLAYCEPIIKCTNSAAITITLPVGSQVPNGTSVQIEAHGNGSVTIAYSTYTFTATLTNGNPTVIPLEFDGTNWHMICVG